MTLPERLPVGGPFGKLYEWLNAIRDYVASLAPVQSHKMLTTHTTIGVAREPIVKPGDGAGSSGGFIPRWG